METEQLKQQYILEALDQASATLSKVKGAFEETNKEIENGNKKASQSFQQSGNAFKTNVAMFNGGVGDIKMGLGQLEQSWKGVVSLMAGGLIGQATMDMISYRDTVADVREAFQGTFPNAAQDLKMLSSAVKGTVSNFNLMKMVNTTIAKEVPANMKQMADLMTLAKDRAEAMGMGTQEAYQSITQGIAGAMERGLRNVGVIIDSTKAYEDAGKAIGKTGKGLSDYVSNLTDAQKKQIFLNTVLKEYGSTIENANKKQADFGDKLEQFQISFGSLKGKIQDAMIKGLMPMIEGMGKFVDIISKIDPGLLGFIANVGVFSALSATAAIAVNSISTALSGAGLMLRGIGMVIAASTAPILLYVTGFVLLAAAINELTRSAVTGRTALDDFFLSLDLSKKGIDMKQYEEVFGAVGGTWAKDLGSANEEARKKQSEIDQITIDYVKNGGDIKDMFEGTPPKWATDIGLSVEKLTPLEEAFNRMGIGAENVSSVLAGLGVAASSFGTAVAFVFTTAGTLLYAFFNSLGLVISDTVNKVTTAATVISQAFHLDFSGALVTMGNYQVSSFETSQKIAENWNTAFSSISNSASADAKKIVTAIDTIPPLVGQSLQKVPGQVSIVKDEVMRKSDEMGQSIRNGVVVGAINATQGVKKELTPLPGVVKTIGNESKQQLDIISKQTEAVGQNFGIGFSDGILWARADAMANAWLIGRAAIDSLKTSINSNSPSIEAMIQGGFFTEGFAIGIKNLLGLVVAASTEVGKGALTAVALPMKQLDTVMEGQKKRVDELKKSVESLGATYDYFKGRVEGVLSTQIQGESELERAIFNKEKAVNKLKVQLAEYNATGDELGATGVQQRIDILQKELDILSARQQILSDQKRELEMQVKEATAQEESFGNIQQELNSILPIHQALTKEYEKQNDLLKVQEDKYKILEAVKETAKEGQKTIDVATFLTSPDQATQGQMDAFMAVTAGQQIGQVGAGTGGIKENLDIPSMPDRRIENDALLEKERTENEYIATYLVKQNDRNIVIDKLNSWMGIDLIIEQEIVKKQDARNKLLGELLVIETALAKVEKAMYVKLSDDLGMDSSLKMPKYSSLIPENLGGANVNNSSVTVGSMNFYTNAVGSMLGAMGVDPKSLKGAFG